jgi:hypothetical protein
LYICIVSSIEIYPNKEIYSPAKQELMDLIHVFSPNLQLFLVFNFLLDGVDVT